MLTKSHPTWVRGLKLISVFIVSNSAWSHPTWVRGLKQVTKAIHVPGCESHPTWVRGLKPVLSINLNHPKAVAPYVGAWIETKFTAVALAYFDSRTLRGCVD